MFIHIYKLFFLVCMELNFLLNLNGSINFLLFIYVFYRMPLFKETVQRKFRYYLFWLRIRQVIQIFEISPGYFRIIQRILNQNQTYFNPLISGLSL